MSHVGTKVLLELGEFAATSGHTADMIVETRGVSRNFEHPSTSFDPAIAGVEKPAELNARRQ